VWERTQKLDILKQLQTHFKAKHEKSVGTPFPRVTAPLRPWLNPFFTRKYNAFTNCTQKYFCTSLRHVGVDPAHFV